MIKHVVMWKMKTGDDSSHKIGHALELKRRLENLTASIIEIKKIEVGMNFSLSKAAYDIVLYTEFETKTDLEHYQSHPEHVKVKEFIGNVTELVAVVDYEI